jgi:hypothetical protein
MLHTESRVRVLQFKTVSCLIFKGRESIFFAQAAKDFESYVEWPDILLRFV